MIYQKRCLRKFSIGVRPINLPNKEEVTFAINIETKKFEIHLQNQKNIQAYDAGSLCPCSPVEKNKNKK